jgi:hypothetical protein
MQLTAPCVYLSNNCDDTHVHKQKAIGLKHQRSWAHIVQNATDTSSSICSFVPYVYTSQEPIVDVSSTTRGTDRHEIEAFQDNLPNQPPKTIFTPTSNDEWLQYEDNVAARPFKFFKTRMQRARRLCGVGVHVLSRCQERPDLDALRAKYWKKYWLARKRYIPEMHNSLSHKTPAQLTDVYLKSIMHLSQDKHEIQSARTTSIPRCNELTSLSDWSTLLDTIEKVCDVMHEGAAGKDSQAWTLRRWALLRPEHVDVRMWRLAYFYFRSSHATADRDAENKNLERAMYTFQLGIFEQALSVQTTTSLSKFAHSHRNQCVPAYVQFKRATFEPLDVQNARDAAIRLQQLRTLAWCKKYVMAIERSIQWIKSPKNNGYFTENERNHLWRTIKKKRQLVDVPGENYYHIHRSMQPPSHIRHVDSTHVREYYHPEVTQMLMGYLNYTDEHPREADFTRQPNWVIASNNRVSHRHLFYVRRKKLAKLRRHDESHKHQECFQSSFCVDVCITDIARSS